MRKKLIAPVLVITVAVGTASTTAQVAKKYIVVGGGSETGVYYQVALSVCKLVNEKLESQGYVCLGRPSLGSVFNIRAIRRGLLNFGVVQSDRNYQAYNGKGEWAGWSYKGLRSVFSVYPETVMLVTRADTGITSVNDLRERRVNIGNPGSGTRGNAVDVLTYYGIDKNFDITATGLQQHEANRALVDKKIDAFFYTVGNPWQGGVELAKRTKIRMIPINAPSIKEFVANRPYYVTAAIPGGIYEGVDKDVPTYAVKATLVTSEREPEEVVYDVVKTVFENLNRFRKMHAAFSSLKPEDMLQGLSPPLHPGALRYYKEKGWM